MTDLTQKLPVEVLAEILGHVSAPDILRFKQVESTTHLRTHQLKTGGFDRSIAPSETLSFRLLWFNTR